MKTRYTILRLVLVAATIAFFAGCDIFIVSDDDNDGPILLDARNTTVTDARTVAAKSDQEYEVIVSSGFSYDLTLTDLTADADLYVYSNAAFTTEVDSSRNASTLDDYLTINGISSERMYVRVRNVASEVTSYTLIVMER